MATNALVNVNQIVDEFLFGYKRPTEDAFLYLKHACSCARDFHLYDSPNVVSAKVTISALGIIEMPDDMIGFNGLFIPLNGELWPFTERNTIVNTTTLVGLVETQDSDFGEGVALDDPKSDTYGGVGGVNDYYYTIDWKARRIFCEGITSDTVLLRYVTTGIELTGETVVPELIRPLIEDYLLWKECYWIPGLERYCELRERNYTKTELKIRNFLNSMTYDQWKDLLLSLMTQAPLR